MAAGSGARNGQRGKEGKGEEEKPGYRAARAARWREEEGTEEGCAARVRALARERRRGQRGSGKKALECGGPPVRERERERERFPDLAKRLRGFR